MPRDTLEGTVYFLPATLQWETITDMEELSTLEISSFANAATVKIPIAVWSKVIRASSLVKRASEEEEMVVSELAMMNERLIDEHSLVLRNIQQKKTCTPSNYVQGCLNLLHRRLLLCETALLCFSEKVHLHHKAFIPNLLLLDNSSYQGSHIQDNKLHTSELDDHGSDRETYQYISSEDEEYDHDSDDSL